jgi:N-acetylmuramoyl-L-alanine amidase
MASRHWLAILATLMCGVLLIAQGTTPPAPLVLLSREGRRPLPTTLLNGQEEIALDDLATTFHLVAREETAAGGLTVTYKGKTIVVSTDQAMASVAGRVVALPSPPIHAGRRWFVPVEFVSRALAQIYDARIDLRKGSRLLILGDLKVPRITARIEPAGPVTRLIVDIAPPAPVVTTTEGGRVLLHIDADAIDMPVAVVGSGLVEQVRPGDGLTVVAVLRPGADGPRSTTSSSDAGTHVTVDVPPAAAAQAPAATGTPPAPQTPSAQGDVSSLVPQPHTGVQVMVIDPGHGGDDAGVHPVEGAPEKQLALEVARRIKGLVEARLGIRVVLTRDDDRAVTADDRGAAANNSKGDLFVSLHFNAAFSPSATGAEVYYLASIPESEQAIKGAGAESAPLPTLGGTPRSVEFIPWNMAQLRHTQDSAALAGLLEELLRAHIPMAPRPLQQAPLRGLVGVDMPAVLIELAYLTNPSQAKAAATDDFQNGVAQAIYDAVVRFRAHLESGL